MQSNLFYANAYNYIIMCFFVVIYNGFIPGDDDLVLYYSQ